MSITLVATMTVRRRELAAFRQYEARAAGIMERYGGAVERTVFVDADPTEELVKEVHILTFPDESAFARYRADQELAAAAPLRSRAVTATELLIGVDGPRYGHARVRPTPPHVPAPRVPAPRIPEPFPEPPRNEFGDPEDTLYTGGTPLFDETGGLTPRRPRRR